MRHKIVKIREYKLFLLLGIIYFLWLLVLPFNQGPDEFMRNSVLESIIELGRLPIPGDNNVHYGPWGYSYGYLLSNLPYILASYLYRIFNSILEMPIFVYGRIISIISGFFANIYFYKILKLLRSDENIEIKVLIFGLWPQIAFMYTYTNVDGISILLSTSLIYYVLLGIEKRWEKTVLIKIGIVVGLSILSYYFLYSIVLAMFLVFCIDIYKKKDIEVKKIIIPLLIVLIVIAPYVIKNIILYREIFSTRVVVEINEAIGRIDLKASLRENFYNLNKGFSYMLFNKMWIRLSYLSYIGVVNIMNNFLSNYFYLLYTGLYILAILKIKKVFNFIKNKKIEIYFIGLLLGIVINFLLFLQYNYFSDYQPQGRYLLYTAPGFILILILLLDSYKNKIFLYFLAFLNLMSVLYFIDTYNKIELGIKTGGKIFLLVVILIISIELLKKYYLLFLVPVLIFGYSSNLQEFTPKNKISIERINKKIYDVAIISKKTYSSFVHIVVNDEKENKELILIQGNNFYKKLNDSIIENEGDNNFIVMKNDLKNIDKLKIGVIEDGKIVIDENLEINLNEHDFDKTNDKLMNDLKKFTLEKGMSNIDQLIKGKKYMIADGWSIIPNIESKEVKIYVEIDNKLINTETKERKDVTNFFNNSSNYDQCGFRVKIPYKLFKNKEVYLLTVSNKNKIFYRKRIDLEDIRGEK